MNVGSSLAAAPLPVQLSADVPGKAAEDVPSAWIPASHMGALDMEFQAPDFILVQPKDRNQRVENLSPLSLSLS